MTQMHVDELAVDEHLVRALLEDQFPAWAGLPLRRIEPSGTVNAIFRLGDDLAVRLPRLVRWSLENEAAVEWLPRLAPLLPLRVPLPAARGLPGAGYPCHWSVVTWIDGDSGVDAPFDPAAAAHDLACFVAALRRADPAGAPAGRGIPLAERDPQVAGALAELGNEQAAALWAEAVAAPAWDGPPVWHHGDLDARNWLVHDGRIAGVIDWGSMGVGDPACDVMVAWKLHSAEAAPAFRAALGVDDDTWLRARGWAVSQAAMALTYYSPENNPTLYREAERWLELACSDRE